MKIQILSDLHLEFKYYRIKIVKDAEVLVIAGDFTVAESLGKIETFTRSIQKPVVYVAGNHDYYGGVFHKINEKLEQINSNLPNFHFLNDKCVEIGDVKFIGSTMWSNFDLSPNSHKFARLAGLGINDFLTIDKSSTLKFSPYYCMGLNVIVWN